MTRHMWRAGALLALCLESCSPPEPVADIPDAASYATSAVASSMDATGRFLLADPEDPTPHLGRMQAGAIAEWAARNYAPFQRDWLEASRGSALDFDNLRKCGVIRWAEPPNVAPPEAELPFAHWVWGPWWIVTLCDGATPVLGVAVAAYATHMVMVGGELTFDPIAFGPRGDEVLMRGIPAGWESALPLSPETAASRVAQRSQRRIARVPRLILPTQPGWPFDAKWELTLDRPVRVRRAAGAGTQDVQRVYLGNRMTLVGDARRDQSDELSSASAEAPSSVTVRIPGTIRPDGGIDTRPYTLMSRDSLPLTLEPVQEVLP